MGAALSVFNDTDAELIDAHIFTPGQGICLQKLDVSHINAKNVFTFNKGLAYGSWYDVVVRIKCLDEQQTYLLTGIYLSVDKCLQLSTILQEKYRVDGDDKPKWKCENNECEEMNESGINMCLYCYQNYARKYIIGLSFVPVVGLPFSITNAVLETGCASHTGKAEDIVNARIAITAAIADIILTPLLVNSLINAPAMAAVNTGRQLTTETLFTGTGVETVKIMVNAARDAHCMKQDVLKIAENTFEHRCTDLSQEEEVENFL
jgi:hypothetical protein